MCPFLAGGRLPPRFMLRASLLGTFPLLKNQFRTTVFSEVDTEHHFPGFRKRHFEDLGVFKNGGINLTISLG